MTTRLATTLVLLTLWLALPANAYPAPGRTTLLSVSSDGIQPPESSAFAVLSADGTTVVFSSGAALVPEDTNDVEDYYVRDLIAGTIERVSVTSDGQQIDGESASSGRRASLSADGRIVAFESGASHLVPGDDNGVDDIFVHDRETGETIRVSVGQAGGEAAWESKVPVVSGDGRYVFFIGEDDTLVEGDASPYEDIFRRDLQTGALELVTRDGQGNQSVFDPNGFAVSHDGNVVAFAAISPSYVVPDANGPVMDIFVKDLTTGAVELISRAPGGAPGNGNSLAPSISADGRSVAFASLASNLVPDDRNGWVDVFVHDRSTGRTRRVSMKTSGDASAVPSGTPHISADGRYVAFNGADTLDQIEERNTGTDAWVHDLWTDTSTLASAGPTGASGSELSINPTISGDGRLAAFHSSAGDLVPGDANFVADAFLRDLGPALGVGELRVDGTGEASGWARFAGVASAATDPANDATVQARTFGGEMIGARLVWRPEKGDLFLRVELDSLPHAPAPGTILGVPGIHYAIGLKVGDTSYQVRVDPAAGERPPVVLHRCAPTCAPVETLPGGLGVAGLSLTTSIPAELLGASAGAEVHSINATTTFSQPGISTSGDSLGLPSLTLETPRVELGVSPAGTPATEVAYTQTASPVDGLFAADLGELAAGEEVWARACLGTTCSDGVRA